MASMQPSPQQPPTDPAAELRRIHAMVERMVERSNILQLIGESESAIADRIVELELDRARRARAHR